MRFECYREKRCTVCAICHSYSLVMLVLRYTFVTQLHMTIDIGSTEIIDARGMHPFFLLHLKRENYFKKN